MAPTILVTGGAGYIGSHTVLALRERGREVVVVDDLSEGHQAALRGTRLIQGSILDPAFIDDVFSQSEISAVMHFAARCYVGESVRVPGQYYETNVVGTKQLLDAMVRHGVRQFVLSSTCATYGEPAVVPITEDAIQSPVNPYGVTKLIDEWMLRDYHVAHGIDSVCLRYFNAAGADPQGRLGEDHHPETHLIPLVISAALGRSDGITIYGNDYPTPDGTCIRDYVHVTDLAEAHILALESLEKETCKGMTAFNLGSQVGNSVLEVIRATERQAGVRIPYVMGCRRPGDPPRLIGSSAKITRDLGWKPRLGDIDSIVGTALRWHRENPYGYGDRR